MNTIVTKFGGSSLADSIHFKKVKNILESNPERKYIIPSAPGKSSFKDFKITDLLYLCHAHVKSGISLDDVFKLISERYKSIVDDLNLNLDLTSYLNIIKTDIENGASVDYGSNEHGDIVTFSRGGSDITGALVAASINAKLYENWTDVSGFLMADPRIVNNPKKIKTITYGELRELSYMGASVLHEEAVFPVRTSGIPINIRNTNEPENAGTLFVSNEIKHENTITGIAGKQNFTVLSIEKSMMNSELGFCRKILTILEQNGVSFENMPSGIDTVSVVISDSNLKNKTEIIVEEIKRACNPDSVVVYPNMALIATVGTGMAYTKGVASKIFTALAESDINIRMIDQGSSEINVLVGIENDDFEKGINAIYKAFN